MVEAGINFAIEYILYIKQDVFSESVNKLLVELRVILQNIRSRKAESSNQLSSIYNKAPKTKQNVGPGRPLYEIKESTLLELRDLGFNWKEISAMLLVSRSTIWRRVNQLGISDKVCFYLIFY